MGWDHLMHATEVGDEVTYSLSIKVKPKQRKVRNKTSNFVWNWRMVQPTHSRQR